MQKLLLLLLIYMSTNTAFAQEHAELIVSTVLRTDYTFHRMGKLLLHNNGRRNEITYTLYTGTQKLKTGKYLVEKYSSLYNGKITYNRRLTRHYNMWSNTLPVTEFQKLAKMFNANMDTVNPVFMVHTSHYALTLFVCIIQGSDTVWYSKTEPFDKETAWLSGKSSGSVLNPEIDKLIAALLPKKFLAREKLLQLPERE